MFVYSILLKKTIKMNLINLYKRNKTYVLYFFSAFIFSYIINFAIDVIFYGDIGKQGILKYFLYNIPAQIVTLIIYTYIIKFFNNNYWRNKIHYKIMIYIPLSFMIANIGIVILLLLFANYKGAYGFYLIMRQSYIDGYVFSISIEILILLFFLEISYLNIINKNKELENQRIILENERYKYNQLKNQINPHFLFNSFNVLNEMLYIEKPEKSSEYVSALSDFYRYVLANQEHETVLLREELDFIEHYISILTIRYSNNLIVDISVKDSDLEKRVVPMTMQILIENAAKHNIISNDQQLKINIESDEDYIIVSNKINLRMDKIDSTGIGLNNLIETYRLFSNKKVEIINDNSNFIVKVPLI